MLPTLSLHPLIDAVLVLLNDAHRLGIESLAFLVVLLEELVQSGTDNVLLLQLLTESNVIQSVTVSLARKEAEAAHLLYGADTAQRLGCRRLLHNLRAHRLV